MSIEVAVVNKKTGEVENVIVVDNLPNHEEEEHFYVSTHKEVKRIRKGWKYNKEKMEFFTDNPDLEEKSYSVEEMLKMEELAWEKMLESVKVKAKEKQKQKKVKQKDTVKEPQKEKEKKTTKK